MNLQQQQLGHQQVFEEPANASVSSQSKYTRLDLENVSMRKLDGLKYEYNLDFGCSSLKLVFVRQYQLISISQMSMDLHSSWLNKSSCVISMPKSGVYPLAVQGGTKERLAHLECRERRTFRCYALDDNGLAEREPLVELKLVSLEFETAPGGSDTKLKRAFQVKKVECPATGAAAATASGA